MGKSIYHPEIPGRINERDNSGQNGGQLADLVLGGISSKMVLFLFWSNAGTGI